MPNPRERRGDESTSRTADKAEEPQSNDQPDRPGQPGDLGVRDRAGTISPRTPGQAEGERGDGA